MLIDLNNRLFLALNASAHPDAVTVAVAEQAAFWIIYAAAALVPALWFWGRRDVRGALLAAVLGVSVSLGVNQLLGLLWYEPRPFMVGLGSTLVSHAVENSFPSDHATFLWSLGFGLSATGASRRWGVVVCACGLLVAWARIYLGLHFPIDMAASLLVGIAGGVLARAAQPAIERWVLPVVEGFYEASLSMLHLPSTLVPSVVQGTAMQAPAPLLGMSGPTLVETITPGGLSQDEVRQRVEAGQVNKTARFTTRTVAGILRNNALTLFTAVLTASVAALLLIGAYNDAVFIGAVTVINVLAGVVGELRAKRALDQLSILAQRRVRVMRDGGEKEIPSDEVVKDDVVLLQSGDPVVADGVVQSASKLFLDESLLTGEADPVPKNTSDPVSSGSYCARGSGSYVATGIGAASNVNVLTAQAKDYKISRSPLETTITRIVQGLTTLMILLAVLLGMAAYIKELGLAPSILAMVTVIKALVPEGLVLVTTVTFALGALRAARKDVLVQKLNAVERMSHLTALCFDKTGTLATNKLIYDRLEVLNGELDEVTDRLQRFMGATGDKNQTILAIEGAYSRIPSAALDELPFSSEQKVSAVRVRVGDAELSLWLGAPEFLGQGRLTPDQEARMRLLNQEGLRVLAFGSTQEAIPNRQRLLLLAFVVLHDELRPDVAETIDFFEARGVKLRVLSGDNPETVAVLARQAGLLITGTLISGPELDGLGPDRFREVVQKGQVFGRLTPHHKQSIVRCLHAGGDFVGMIGDGVNDILALKEADIGIAMNSGAAAARDVADIVLLRNSFAHLPALSHEGDRIIYNVKRIARLFLTKNAYSLFFILFAGFIGLAFPFSPRFITWIDVLTIGTPAFLLTLMTAPVPKQTMDRFFSDVFEFAVTTGLVIALVSLLVYANFSLFQDRAESYGRTAALSVIVLLGLYVVYRVTKAERAADAPRVQRLGVWAIIGSALVLHALAVYWATLRDFLGMVSLDADSWLTIAAAFSVGAVILHRMLKNDFWKRA